MEGDDYKDTDETKWKFLLKRRDSPKKSYILFSFISLNKTKNEEHGFWKRHYSGNKYHNIGLKNNETCSNWRRQRERNLSPAKRVFDNKKKITLSNYVHFVSDTTRHPTNTHNDTSRLCLIKDSLFNLNTNMAFPGFIIGLNWPQGPM